MNLSRLSQSSLRWSSIVVLALVCARPAGAFSSAPGSCTVSDTYPVHGNAQVGTGGFLLASSSATYAAGQPITVTLSGPQAFRGLLLYALDSGGLHRGTFAVPSGYAPMNSCAGDPSSTLGQANSLTKSVPVGFTWTAPAATEPLFFFAAVLINVATYFVLDPTQITPVVDGVETDGAPEGRAGLALRADPNPFTESTILRYALRREAPVSLRIFDLSGRLVRSILPGAQAPGDYTLEWDGRDEDGAKSGPGVYFVRIDAGSDAQAVRLLRVQSSTARR